MHTNALAIRDLDMRRRSRAVWRVNAYDVGLGVVNARMSKGIVHRLARGGEHIGLVFSWVGLEIFLAAARKTSG